MSGRLMDRVRSVLQESPREIRAGEQTRRAAIAAVLRPRDEDLEILFIRRADRPHDPWAGHMAFPGGRHEPADRDLEATAIRETSEEIGLDLLANGELLGRLDEQVPGSARGTSTRLIVSPFVWLVGAGPIELRPNAVEVDEVHWIPLTPLLQGEHDAIYPLDWRGQRIDFPAYRIGSQPEERLVWGLTHRVLDSFFHRVKRTP